MPGSPGYEVVLDAMLGVLVQFNTSGSYFQ